MKLLRYNKPNIIKQVSRNKSSFFTKDTKENENITAIYSAN